LVHSRVPVLTTTPTELKAACTTTGVGYFADIRLNDLSHKTPQEDFGEEEVITQIVYEDCLQTAFIAGIANGVVSAESAEFQSQGFKLPKTARVKKIALRVFKFGSPGFPMKIEIWPDDSGAPGEPDNGGESIGTSTGNPYVAHIYPDGLQTGTLQGDGVWVEAEFLDDVPELASGTQFHIVLSSINNDSTNLIRATIDTSATAVYPDGIRSNSGDSGATWLPSSGQDINFKIYTTEKPILLALTNLGNVEALPVMVVQPPSTNVSPSTATVPSMLKSLNCPTSKSANVSLGLY